MGPAAPTSPLGQVIPVAPVALTAPLLHDATPLASLTKIFPKPWLPSIGGAACGRNTGSNVESGDRSPIWVAVEVHAQSTLPTLENTDINTVVLEMDGLQIVASRGAGSFGNWGRHCIQSGHFGLYFLGRSSDIPAGGRMTSNIWGSDEAGSLFPREASFLWRKSVLKSFLYSTLSAPYDGLNPVF
jgi:hypothetical protein